MATTAPPRAWITAGVWPSDFSCFVGMGRLVDFGRLGGRGPGERALDGVVLGVDAVLGDEVVGSDFDLVDRLALQGVGECRNIELRRADRLDDQSVLRGGD